MIRGAEPAWSHVRNLAAGFVGSLGIVALFPFVAQAAPPPEALVLVSARSVQQEAFAGTITLPNGTIVTTDLVSKFEPHVVLETDLLLWDVAADSVRVATEEIGILEYGTSVAYRSSDSSLWPSILIPSSVSGRLADTSLRLPGVNQTIRTWLLSEPGTILVLNPSISVPELNFSTAVPVLAIALSVLARRRARVVL